MTRKLIAAFALAAGAVAGSQFTATAAYAQGLFIERQCFRFNHFCGGFPIYQAARQFYDPLGRPLISKRPRVYGKRNNVSPLGKRYLRKKRSRRR